MSNPKKIIMSVTIGLLLGMLLMLFVQPSETITTMSASNQPQPLYWVAPMDANYRRDKPGKSPMGMDLIPFFESSDANTDAGPGTVSISAQVMQNLGIRTAAVEYRPLQKSINTVGYVKYDEDKLVHIHPRVEGWIDKLYITAAGNPVKKGEPLYTLYSPQLVNAQEEFLIALKRKNSTLVKAARERLLALHLPPTYIQDLEQKQHVKQAITFYAPQSGVVDVLNVRHGFYVKPGTTIMSIGNLEKVWVMAEVFERDAAFVEEGMTASMTLDYLPGKEWQGEIDYVYPSIDAKTRTLSVRLRFDNPEVLLKPNMFAQVILTASDAQKTLLVPNESVIRTGMQDRVVLALGDGMFKSVLVKIGRTNQQYIEIREGLQEGNSVVSSGQFLIDSESSVSAELTRLQEQSNAVVVESATSVPSATVNGVINKIDMATRTINISREAIEKWDRPASTMDFVLAENIDLSTLVSQMAVTFTFEIREEFIITAIKPVQVMSHNKHMSH